MSLAPKLLLFFFDLVLPLGVGYGFVRLTRLKRSSLDPLLEITVAGVVPWLALLSFWKMDLAAELMWLPFLGVIMQVVAGMIGFFRSRTKAHDPLEKGSYVLATILSNRGMLGGLSVFILFGEMGYAYSRLVILFSLPMLYGVCFPMARRFGAGQREEESSGTSLLSLLLHRNQLPLVGIAIGGLLNYAGVQRPEVLGHLFRGLIHVVAWLFLIPIGASADFGEMRGYWRDVADLIPLKFVVTPLLLYALGRAAGLGDIALGTVVICAATPTAINAVMTAKLHDLNQHLVMAAFVLTTGVYLVFVFPAILLLFSLLGIG